MNKELHKTIPIGTELTYSDENCPFYTKGNKYKIRSCLIQYQLDDDRGAEDHHWSKSILDSFYLPKEETKPVYTQSMHSNGELPSIGCEVKLSVSEFAVTTEDVKSSNNNILLVVAHHGGLAVAVDENSELGFSIMANYGWFKPLDTRSPEQKTIDDINKVDQDIHGVHNFAKNFIQAVKNNEIHDISFTGSK